MSGLLEVADAERVSVVRVPVEQFDSVGCSMVSYAVDVCDPQRTRVSGFDGTSVGTGLDSVVFSAVVQLRGRLMCRKGDEPNVVDAAIEAEAEKVAGNVLWNGFEVADPVNDPGDPVYLTHPDVHQVAAGADAESTLANLLEAFWDRTVGVQTSDTILHVGSERLLRMLQKSIVNDRLLGYDIKVAASPGYSRNSMALTGPIMVKMGPNQVLEGFDTEVNGYVVEGSRLLSMSFDPCFAVRAAEPV